MKIFKFGGASVKDAAGVRNVIRVLKTVEFTDLVIVVSAMGKTTNAMEVIVENYLQHPDSLEESLVKIFDFHTKIIKELFGDNDTDVKDKIQALFLDLRTTLERNKSKQYDYCYDQIVGYGELFSTVILSEYLMFVGVANQWLDARNVIKTDNGYRRAKVDWDWTEENIRKEVVSEGGIYVTQGFIGSDINNFSTTLGREGSDYTAGIFAYCLHAENVTIWKDVPGVLNGDPRVFEGTELLQEISYEEAIELAFYGASVIHPKTLQPLQRKEIPLYVKSFLHPANPGTSVKKGQALVPYMPCYIVKKDQILLSLSSLDFSFIVEKNISEIFELFDRYKLKVDLIQNSAISFSVCVEDKFNLFDTVADKLKLKFAVNFEKNVSLYTIRHFTKEAVQKIEGDKDVLLKQSTRETFQMIVKQ
ncbi:aspartate kinase [Aquimarina hainanensis]|uniref:Aspartokinase n=1 Tax=Aquimarina hainanensis TaxID=1578017 RepID=A0ABW5N4G6_9FLAO|nr:aspartate kinase [Aquimarina sp. TRL1]QKX04959.1 aspartate kinase [Aquimarina sp. TRL1]